MKIRQRRNIKVGSRSLTISVREKELLDALPKAPEESWKTAEELEQEVTGEVLDNNPGHWTRTTICRLRDKIMAAGLGSVLEIENVYGRGYRLIDNSTILNGNSAGSRHS
jgi:DNA-binding response OmpR family regulator